MAINWDRIENFIGFGNPMAPVVFLGMEEGLRRDSDLHADLEMRSTYDAYMDLAEAQGKLEGAGSYFGSTPVTQNTWRPMCHLMLKREGIENPRLEQRARYQADRLGRLDGDTLLCELLPYPHSDTGQWLYAEFGRYATRTRFEADIIPRRQEIFRKAFTTHRPELIVAYGKSNWPAYKDIFGDAEWHKADAFEYAIWGQTRVVLAHQLAGRLFNKNEQLDTFADVALAFETPDPTESKAISIAPARSGSDTHAAERRANRSIRDAFGGIAKAYRISASLSFEEVSSKAKTFAGQGNPGGVRNLESGYGWVHPPFAEGV
ncbi:MAG: hypothetical protein M3N13_11190, partial [Candidatus Eremiobacteraeota bacterium]|nr:hypothetical protein [Candidatus Eremiobacteraeota bacterium]